MVFSGQCTRVTNTAVQDILCLQWLLYSTFIMCVPNIIGDYVNELG
ncbi:hypothetical protein GBAR_LOCUS29226, partial [Geodia barretti]